MRFSIRKTRSALLALLLACACPVVAVAQEESDGARYLEPDFETEIFRREAILLEPQEVDATVTALAALAANFPGEQIINHTLRAKALAIALRMDGTQSAALATNQSLKEAEVPGAIEGYDRLESVAEKLWETAGFLETPEMTRDERVLQFCVVEIARAVDPENLEDSNLYPTKLPDRIFPGWSDLLTGGEEFVFPNPDPDPDPGPGDGDEGDPDNGEGEGDEPMPVAPTQPTRTAQGEMIATIAAAPGDSGLTKISGDLKAGGGSDPLAIVFSNENGKTKHPLNRSRKLLVSALTELHGGEWAQDGGVLVLTVPRAGDPSSQLLPAAILADSLLREKEIHDRVVALGFVAPEGSLMPISRIADHLRGLPKDAADFVIVPEANLPELRDMLLLDEMEAFFRHQIIVASTLGEAVKFAAAEREESLTESLDDFKTVQVVAADDGNIAEMTSFKDVKDYFAKVIANNPRHASAILLNEHGSDQLPEHLTRNGSLSALYRATEPVVRAMQDGGKADRAQAAASFKAIEKFKDKLDPATSGLSETIGELLRDIARHAEGTGDEQLEAKIVESWKEVGEEIRRLKKES